MRLNEVIFINNLPTLDLHGYDRASAVVAVSDFIRDNLKLKNQVIVIIHGVGEGLLKKAVHDYLKKEKNVKEFKTYYFNQGCTLAELNF